MSAVLDRPVIFVGNGRSGTTIIFEAFSTHDEVAWLSNYSQSFPNLPVLNVATRLFDNPFVFIRGENKQHQKIYFMNRLLPRPSEAYPFWESLIGTKFSREYLLDTTATSDERKRLRNVLAKTVKYQSKRRLAIKITGPSRIMFLNSIFPDAIFFHIIRDGRAVVSSLLDVDLWKQKGGLERPFWEKGFKNEYLETWHDTGKDPAVLAALQWRNIIEIAREESQALGKDRYHELRYEEFIKDPHGVVSRMYEITGLHNSARVHRFIDNRIRPKNMNYKFTETFDSRTLQNINRNIGDLLEDLGSKYKYYTESVNIGIGS